MSTIRIVRTVPTTPDRVFAAWTDPEELAQWWWPHLADTTYAVDATVGGRYRFVSASAGIGAEGEYLVVDPPHTLRMTWTWLDDGIPAPVVDEVIVTFAPAGTGTEVTVSHASTAHLGADGGAEQGWNDVLDRLPGHFS